MRVLFDFQCPDGHKFERLINSDEFTTDCKTCGKTAKRLISPVRTYLDPLSGDFPGATMKWAKGREEKINQEKKTIDNHGKIDW